ncbi:hypothetical protein BDF22DRAFT_662362 [Syncephalis plumigaleata]|nr:hypothetical protein BDF22DRAFT_662362 [Syncephalis plumigaleata]
MHSTIITKSTLILILGAVLTIDAQPQIGSNYVGFTEKCGFLNNSYRYCQICLKTGQSGDPCDNDSTRCAAGLKCSITPGQWRGTCVGGAPWHLPGSKETYVGLGQRCGYINAQSETVCLKPARVGEYCDYDEMPCAYGLKCKVQLGKWSGTCIANSSQ